MKRTPQQRWKAIHRACRILLRRGVASYDIGAGGHFMIAPRWDDDTGLRFVTWRYGQPWTLGYGAGARDTASEAAEIQHSRRLVLGDLQRGIPMDAVDRYRRQSLVVWPMVRGPAWGMHAQVNV